MEITIKQAYALRKALLEGAPSLTDATASTVPMIFNVLKQDGSLVKAGTRINWNGKLKKATVDLWDTLENNPDNAPVLWEDIAYKDGYRYIPENITVSSSFGLDECGWWEEHLYKSLLDTNVWTPTQHPSGWQLIQ